MTQGELILAHLQKGGTITAAEAVERWGCYRLGARIYDLKHKGYPIVSIAEMGTNREGSLVRYARYRMGVKA